MSSPPSSRLAHRFAVITACLALLPIVFGAVTTTLNAGMAFPDWPSSDGHNMLTYPWLATVKTASDKFVEHGHRLAGMLIGVCSILLAAILWRTEPRRWVRALGLAILLGVIVQGVLGGARVLQDERVLAMVHGTFAAWVFTLIGCVAMFTSPQWNRMATQAPAHSLSSWKPLALLTPLVVNGQYMLGGLVRHFGAKLDEHLFSAIFVAVCVLATVVGAFRSGSPWLRRSAGLLLALLLIQASLGAAAWVTRFGFPWTGYVAVQHSVPQVLARTTHTVVGMLVLMTSVIYAIRLFRVDRAWCEAESKATDAARVQGELSLEGGMA